MSVPLYELTAQFRELQLLAEDPECDPRALADTFDGIEGMFHDKAKAIAGLIGNLTADADAIDDAAAAMKKRADRLRSRSEQVRTYLLVNMQAMKCPPIKCPFFTIRVRDNPPHVEVLNEGLVPDDYRVAPPETPPRQPLDKRKLLDALKAGAEIPGAKIARNQRLEIKA